MWKAFLEIKDVFTRLCWHSWWWFNIDRFFVFLYNRTGSTASVNGARHWLFAKKGRSLDNCPPTLNGLLQHVCRSILQSSNWCQTWNLLQLLPDQSNIERDDDFPICMNISEAAKSCLELAKCGCKTNCFVCCKCKKAGSYFWTLLFWMGGSCFEKTVTVLPFLPQISYFDIILA